MRAVVDHAVQECLALDALAHEPALHVRDRHDDRVDLALANPALELEEPKVLVGLVSRGPVIRAAHGRPSRVCCEDG